MSEWQPIETAPKDGTAVYLFGKNVRCIGYWRTSKSEQWITESNDGDTEVRRRVATDQSSWCVNMHEPTGYPFTAYLYFPTHWMPLPSPPTESK